MFYRIDLSMINEKEKFKKQKTYYDEGGYKGSKLKNKYVYRDDYQDNYYNESIYFLKFGRKQTNFQQ